MVIMLRSLAVKVKKGEGLLLSSYYDFVGHKHEKSLTSQSPEQWTHKREVLSALGYAPDAASV